jgi:hypothetical protein
VVGAWAPSHHHVRDPRGVRLVMARVFALALLSCHHTAVAGSGSWPSARQLLGALSGANNISTCFKDLVKLCPATSHSSCSACTQNVTHAGQLEACNPLEEASYCKLSRHSRMAVSPACE